MKKQVKLWAAAAVIAVAGGSASVAMASTKYMTAVTPDNTQVHTQTDKSGHVGKERFQFAIKGGPESWKSNTELLTLLHLTSDELAQQLKDGKTLADITTGQGVDKQQVIDLLVKQQTAQIDAEISAGKLPTEKATALKKGVTEMVTASVEGKKGAMAFGEHGGPHKFMFGGKDLADFLNITQDELKTELQSGKKLLDVAAAHNVTKEQLTTFFTDQQTKQLDEQLKAGHITQDQYNEMKSHVADRVTNLIEGKGPAVIKKDFKQGQDFKGKNQKQTKAQWQQSKQSQKNQSQNQSQTQPQA
ncbi:hypothetical protein JJB07_17645 [Tumebacillus sp. ITR2]|uniref:LysM domain-containing protein n=1 Tax=Tumebacillus amylolyticus TaxID=2801339 RepID=A0ABS1JDR3_9BACL|nr:hypothetical protein [Tumebacillus amylolyticus]MBL0388433.1 hypothetical protein [Tumebacillus amylolyticus]